MINVVTIGGGTGTYNLLKAIKNIKNINISCIVSVSDDGGSTGRIRDEYGILPPGDLRRAVVALSDDDKTTLLRDLFNHRFNGGSLDGHNLGNLIMLAIEQITGDYGKSIDLLEELFDIKGNIYPSTFEKTRLVAKLENLDYIIGETNIDIPKHDPSIKIQDLYVIKDDYVSVLEKINLEKGISNHIVQSIYDKFFEDKPNENPKIKEVIENADYIILAPGDLYTSILPNLLIGNIIDYINISKAKKLLFVNLFTKNGETNGFDLSHFLKIYEKYFGNDIFDKIFLQDWEKFPIDNNVLDKYLLEGKTIIRQDINDKRIVKGDFVKQNDMIRHDSDKIMECLLKHLI